MTTEALDAISMKLGAGVAEQERPLLSRAFLETPESSKLVNDLSDTIVGGRGHGKSALYEYLLQESEGTGILAADGLGPELTVGNTLSEFFRTPTAATLPSQRWLAFIVGRCAEELLAEMETYELGDTAELEDGLDDIRSLFTTGTADQSLLQAIFRAVQLNAIDESALGAQLETVSNELLLEVIELLSDHDRKMYLLFDKLDEVFISSVNAEIDAVRSLQSAANRVNSIAIDQNSGLRIKLFIRSDIEKLSARKYQGVFQRSPHEELRLTWNKERVSQVIWHRLVTTDFLNELPAGARSKLAEQSQKSAKLDLVFGADTSGIAEADIFAPNGSIWTWVLSATRDATGIYNPRFILKVIGGAIESCRSEDSQPWGPSGLPLVTPKSVYQAWVKTSEFALNERATSYSQVRDVQRMLKVNRSTEAPEFRQQLGEAMNIAPSDVSDYIDALHLSGVFAESGGRFSIGAIFWPAFGARL